MNSTDLMALLIPTIQLGADKDGAQVSTNLTSSSMIFFVSGIFQGQSDAGAAAAVPTAAAAAAVKAAGFVLPGTTLGIFPVDWLLLLGKLEANLALAKLSTSFKLALALGWLSQEYQKHCPSRLQWYIEL
jgi:hypothetical protein